MRYLILMSITILLFSCKPKEVIVKQDVVKNKVVERVIKDTINQLEVFFKTDTLYKDSIQIVEIYKDRIVSNFPISSMKRIDTKKNEEVKEKDTIEIKVETKQTNKKSFTEKLGEYALVFLLAVFAVGMFWFLIKR